MSQSWAEIPAVNPALHVLVARRQFLTEWNFPDLAAPHWRLYVQLDEGAYLRFRRRCLDMPAGSVWLIPPDTLYGSGAEKPFRQCYVHFSLQLTCLPSERRPWRVKGAEADGRTLANLFDAEEDKLWEASLALHRLILNLLTRLPEEMFEVPGRDATLSRALARMTVDLRHSPSNREMAKAMGLHPNAWIRWFKARTGRTPKAFLLARRVQEACILLLHSDRSIEEIAEITGFGDRYHFTRAFVRDRGIGPAAYRKSRAQVPRARWENDAT
ncbi:MAG: hypothetical protein OHK005_14700 [Candidatus Methylacidiphilales bacterium]